MKTRSNRTGTPVAQTVLQLHLFLPPPVLEAPASKPAAVDTLVAECGPDEHGPVDSEPEGTGTDWMKTLEKRIGSKEEWMAQKLGDVINLYYELYAQFVEQQDTLVEEAKDLLRGATNPADKAYFNKRLKIQQTRRGQIYSYLFNQYAEIMQQCIIDTEQRIRQQNGLARPGLDEETEVDGLWDHFNGFFQQPYPEELSLTIRQIADQLITEYTTTEAVL